MTSMNQSRKPRITLSSRPEETERIGIELAKLIKIPGIILLYGELGTGKTTLTRGIAQGLGLEDLSLVNSPSYAIVNTYNGSCPIYHVDLYRLEGERDLFSIGLDDFLGKEGVTIIEWSERLLTEFPEAIIVEIKDAGEEKRELRITAPQKQVRKK
jgi:tRNA threonylcarbamoyladenosine biosynthesis protein TsaE